MLVERLWWKKTVPRLVIVLATTFIGLYAYTYIQNSCPYFFILDTLNNLLKGASNLKEEVYGTLSDVVKAFSQWPHDKMIPGTQIVHLRIVHSFS